MYALMAREYQWTPEVVDSIPDSLLRVFLCGPEKPPEPDPDPETIAAQVAVLTKIFNG